MSYVKYDMTLYYNLHLRTYITYIYITFTPFTMYITRLFSHAPDIQTSSSLKTKTKT